MKILKKGLALLLGTAMLFTQLPIASAEAEAENITEDGFKYTIIIEETGTETTTETIEIVGYSGTDGKITIPNEIDEKPVISIAQEAFKDNLILTDVEISEGIQSIGGMAFSQCTNLKSVTIPSSVNTWKGWYYIGDNKGVANKAFQGCTALETVTFTEGITQLGENIFEGCTSLFYVKIPKSIENISKTFNLSSIKEVEFEEGSDLTAIQTYAFAETPLESITIPEGVTEIDANAFRNCEQLKIVKLPDSLKVLESGAFYECSSIESITIHENLTNISTYVFTHDDSLLNINITSENLSYIGNKETFPKDVIVYAPRDTETWNNLLNYVNGGEINGWVILEPLENHPHDYTTEIVKEATCEENGIQADICDVCGEKEETIIPAKGHQYTVIGIKNPTTTVEGYTLKRCSVCGKQTTEVIPKLAGQGNSQTGSQSGVTVPKVNEVKKLKVKASKKKQCVVQWKKLNGVSGYYIQYSTKKNFKKKTKTVRVGAKKKKKILKKLKSNKKYYVRIQAYKKYKVGNETKIVKGPWSKKKKVKIK